MIPTTRTTLISVAVALAACSTPPPAAPPTTTAAAPPTCPVKEGRVTLARWVPDDISLPPFALDRTGDHAKVKFDGKADVIELTQVDDVKFGERRGWDLLSPDGTRILYMTNDGSISVYTKTGQSPATCRAPSDPLPAATVAGQYVRPKTPAELATEQLAPLTVMKKLAGFKPEESGNLARVGEALAQADASMFVRISPSGAAAAAWAPASAHIGDVIQGLGGRFSASQTDDAFDAKAPGLRKYGGVINAPKPPFGERARLHMWTAKGFPQPLLADTPGVVWELVNGSAVFVTFDGGRYELSLSASDKGPLFVPGLAPVASWPAPLQHALVDVDSARALAKGNAIPAAGGAQIEALDDAWFNCVNDQWKKGEDRLEKIAASTGSMNDKRGKALQVRAEAEQSLPKVCGPAQAKLEKGLVQLIEARNKERLSLFGTVKARVVAMKAAP
jgi:hypothetical protein